jgi:hypothetical protein
MTDVGPTGDANTGLLMVASQDKALAAYQIQNHSLLCDEDPLHDVGRLKSSSSSKCFQRFAFVSPCAFISSNVVIRSEIVVISVCVKAISF